MRFTLEKNDTIRLCPKSRQCKCNGRLRLCGCDHAVPHGEESNCDMPEGSHCPTCAEQTFVIVEEERLEED
jgi:hypothetical protein